MLLLCAVCLAGSPATAQQVPSQTPAPGVRVHPRSQTTLPPATEAPPEAAPLVVRPARPRPVDPRAFSGTGTAQTTPPGATTRPHTSPGFPQPAHTAGAVAASGATATRPHTASSPHPTATGVTTAPSGAKQAASEKSETAPPRSSSGFNRTTVALDPGHGGTDSGSRIGDTLLEKDLTLALAFRLRSLLTARGFTVVMTRDSDIPAVPGSPTATLSLDDRAGIANHAHGSACLLLHATGRGNGVHLYTSELAPAAGEPALPPWLTAQAAWVPASRELERSLGAALDRSHIALVSSSASVRPVDSLTCPALVVELAPENADPRSITDPGYQERVAAAIAAALVFWQGQVQPPGRLEPSSTPAHTHIHHRAAAAPGAHEAPEAQP